MIHRHPRARPATRARHDHPDEELAALCWALAHPMRIRIIRLLLARGTCVCGDIVRTLPVAQSTVSEHLRILKEAGLVAGEVDGPRRCYCVCSQALSRIKDLVGGL